MFPFPSPSPSPSPIGHSATSGGGCVLKRKADVDVCDTEESKRIRTALSGEDHLVPQPIPLLHHQPQPQVVYPPPCVSEEIWQLSAPSAADAGGDFLCHPYVHHHLSVPAPVPPQPSHPCPPPPAPAPHTHGHWDYYAAGWSPHGWEQYGWEGSGYAVGGGGVVGESLAGVGELPPLLPTPDVADGTQAAPRGNKPREPFKDEFFAETLKLSEAFRSLRAAELANRNDPCVQAIWKYREHQFSTNNCPNNDLSPEVSIEAYYYIYEQGMRAFKRDGGLLKNEIPFNAHVLELGAAPGGCCKFWLEDCSVQSVTALTLPVRPKGGVNMKYAHDRMTVIDADLTDPVDVNRQKIEQSPSPVGGYDIVHLGAVIHAPRKRGKGDSEIYLEETKLRSHAIWLTLTHFLKPGAHFLIILNFTYEDFCLLFLLLPLFRNHTIFPTNFRYSKRYHVLLRSYIGGLEEGSGGEMELGGRGPQDVMRFLELMKLTSEEYANTWGPKVFSMSKLMGLLKKLLPEFEAMWHDAKLFLKYLQRLAHVASSDEELTEATGLLRGGGARRLTHDDMIRFLNQHREQPEEDLTASPAAMPHPHAPLPVPLPPTTPLPYYCAPHPPPPIPPQYFAAHSPQHAAEACGWPDGYGHGHAAATPAMDVANAPLWPAQAAEMVCDDNAPAAPAAPAMMADAHQADFPVLQQQQQQQWEHLTSDLAPDPPDPSITADDASSRAPPPSSRRRRNGPLRLTKAQKKGRQRMVLTPAPGARSRGGGLQGGGTGGITLVPGAFVMDG
ncbi:unnamed protein product [Vitrella brassicaformis CCMP3155]|uniref:Ribosomal RNA methyltransferase FtsJ domain-containing protein n=3 Tax=Vitrella brassicaformis TaxID=1169539 RepID=A0A0G4GM32_VITBC|nr:unnamed protein product [Vitrella brassicaformis CCMP3155]|eukprot:CEM31204.1 unnamed protein product [Vitrella brassicaformis CCMP3155]